MRTLYGKFIEYDPTNVTAWVMFAELEGSLQEEERARSLHELALSQPVLNQPEALWMHYIDFELSVGDRAAARALYERLLERTQHVKVRCPPWLTPTAKFAVRTCAAAAVVGRVCALGCTWACLF